MTTLDPTMEDRASKAYNAIRMLLEESHPNPPDDHAPPSRGSNTTFEEDDDEQDEMDGGNVVYNDEYLGAGFEEEDEYAESLVSRRASGAFSPPAARSSRTTTHTTTPKVTRTQSSPSPVAISTIDGGKRMRNHNSGLTSVVHDVAPPVTTPGPTDHFHPSDPLPSSRTLPTQSPWNKGATLAHRRLASSSLPPHTQTQTHTHTHGLTGLDVDYLPYHDALLLLNRSMAERHPYTSDTHRQQDAHSLFALTLRDSLYSRSTTLLDSQDAHSKPHPQHSLVDHDPSVLSARRLLEGEGHLWSLLERLLGNTIRTRTSKKSTRSGGGVTMVTKTRTTGGGRRFVLWTQPYTHPSPHEYHTHQRIHTRTWIQDLVRSNGRDHDPASLFRCLSTRYDLEEEEEEHEGGPNAVAASRGRAAIDSSVVLDADGALDTIMEGEDDEELTSVATTRTSSTSNTVLITNDGTGNRNKHYGNDVSTSLARARVTAVPELLRRRRIVLKWLESCHDRAVVGAYDGGISGTNNRQKKIMWKDTIEALQRQKRGVVNRTTDKITEFHPDAPLLLFLKGTNNRINQSQNQNFFRGGGGTNASSSFSSSSSVEPLYGNDSAVERYLLSTCLSLLKAGRFSEALDMCREYGQFWRAASWNGDNPSGRIRHYNDQDDDDDDQEETKDGEGRGRTTVRIGNPKRALWKRTTWKGGRTLYARLSGGRPNTVVDGGNTNSNNTGTVLAGGSLVYEAAIAAVLADDVETASHNPTLNKTWLDLAWVYYRGMHSRFMEQIYHAHNEVRRESGDSDGLFSLEGTECRSEEIDQLEATEALERMEEETFLSEIRNRFRDGTKATMEEEEEDGSELWRDCMGSFLVGVREVEQFIVRVADAIIAKGDDERVDGIRGNGDESVLRFMLHLLLFLETLSSIEDDTDDYQSDDGEGDDAYLAYFRDEILRPRKDAILSLYVRYLSTQKSLWHLTALYASLLEEEATVEICSEFWLECVVEDVDRRMVLERAREHFVDGLDLVILKGVVRSCISEGEEGMTERNGAESSRPFPSSWLHFSYTNEDGEDFPQFLPNTNLEERIRSADVWKMQSVRWLCFYREHAADALICANLLMRKLLLEAIVFEGKRTINEWGSLSSAKLLDEIVNDRCNFNAEVDWLGNVKLYTAKVFVFRVLHKDILAEVISQCPPTTDTATTRFEESDAIQEDSQLYPGSSSSIAFVRDNISEHRAMVLFLQAHDAYLEWRDIIVSASGPDVGGDDHSHPPDSLEHEIATKMRRKIYVDKKRYMAQGVIKAAEVARLYFMDVLTYDGGWFDSKESNDLPYDGATGTLMEEECALRLEETKMMRSRYLPNALFLLLQVLDGTAKWMEKFARETVIAFGREEGTVLLSRIAGTDTVESGEDGDMDEDDDSSSPFSPETWYQTALLLANTVANNEYDISFCMSQKELKLFMQCMVDLTTSLLSFQERTRSD